MINNKLNCILGWKKASRKEISKEKQVIRAGIRMLVYIYVCNEIFMSVRSREYPHSYSFYFHLCLPNLHQHKFATHDGTNITLNA